MEFPAPVSLTQHSGGLGKAQLCCGWLSPTYWCAYPHMHVGCRDAVSRHLFPLYARALESHGSPQVQEECLKVLQVRMEGEMERQGKERSGSGKEREGKERDGRGREGKGRVTQLCLPTRA
eukprot:scaffold299517_cov14-Tisochrysis_lutea.AAC.1